MRVGNLLSYYLILFLISEGSRLIWQGVTQLQVVKRIPLIQLDAYRASVLCSCLPQVKVLRVY